MRLHIRRCSLNYTVFGLTNIARVNAKVFPTESVTL